MDIRNRSFLVTQLNVQSYISAFRSLLWNLYSQNIVRPLNFKLSSQSPNMQLCKPQRSDKKILLSSVFDNTSSEETKFRKYFLCISILYKHVAYLNQFFYFCSYLHLQA